MRLLYFLVFLRGSLAALIPAQGRGLDDVFGELGPPNAPPPEAHVEHSTEHAISSHINTATGTVVTGTISLGGLLTGVEQLTKTSSKASTSSVAHPQTSTTSSPTSYSIIGTIPPLPTYTPYSGHPPTSSATSAQASPTPTRSQTTESDSHSTQSWKIVGVAVIAFTTVATILLLSVFFDQWWGFIRDLLWKKRRKDHLEEFIPDWEKASWEIKMDKTSNDRYPSFAGPPRKARTKDLWQEKYAEWPAVQNVASVGSGFKPDKKQEPSPSQQTATPAWSLGFVTPVPPPPALHTNFRTREASPTTPFDRRKSRVASTAFSDVDPYAGIE